MKKKLVLLFVFVMVLSCKYHNKVENVSNAFYYWKSNNNLDQETKKNLVKNNIKKMYLKYFEVDYNEAQGNFPYDKTEINSYDASDFENVKITPVIFIKNGIFQFNDEKQLDVLADNINFLINKYNKEKLSKSEIEEEIQIDCDWTKSTKDKYFYLLKKIKELSKKKISCTLRLYPYKYPDIMGIPPVDKATLMCYNLIKPLSNKDKNSILDINELKSYLDKKRTYPVHLDIALPVFYWTQLYQNNKFVGLVNMNTTDFKGFTKQTKPMWYSVTKDTMYGYDKYYRIEDEIKCEEVSKKTLYEAIKIIKQNVTLDKNTTIALFHLDNNTFKKYSNEEISYFYNSFTK